MCILSMYLSKLSNNVKFNCKEKGLESYSFNWYGLLSLPSPLDIEILDFR